MDEKDMIEQTISETDQALLEDAFPPRIRRPLIDALCPRYVCRLCRTKTGWPHQLGCELAQVTEPECADCRYWNMKNQRCDHPAARRERAAK